MRNKEKLYEWIDRFNSNDLSGEDYDRFLTLMNQDLRVREEICLDRDLNDVLKEDDILDLRKKIIKVCSKGTPVVQRDRRVLLAAATLMIAVTIGYSLLYLIQSIKDRNHLEKVFSSTNSQPLNQNVTQPSSQTLSEIFQQKPENLSKPVAGSGEDTFSENLLAIYQPNKSLDYLTGTTYRSGDFSVLSPERNAVFEPNSVILFSWKTENHIETTLCIENNKGVSRYVSDSNTRQSVMIKTTFLGPGLFYYKIIRKDEIVYVGKFVVQ